MKKSIIIATILTLTTILAPFSASAQHGYRGFVDAEIGAAIAGNNAEGNFLALGISTTHGYQTGHWFIGAGAAFMWTPESTCHYWSDGHNLSGDYWNSHHYDKCRFSLPLYVNLRYDFSLIRERNFYAGVKAGYDGIYGGFFTSLSYGLRKTLDNGHSLNFGLNMNMKSGNSAGYMGDGTFTYFIPTLSVGYEF